MGDQLELRQSGLTRTQFELLADHVRQAGAIDIRQLLDQSAQHLAQAEAAHAQNRVVNIRLASAIHHVIMQTVGRWEAIPRHAHAWIKGAILYFTSGDDDEPDFTSPIGFEDDVEVLNACLQFAKLDDLCLKVEDFDDA